jgi:hypothetical protein
MSGESSEGPQLQLVLRSYAGAVASGQVCVPPGRATFAGGVWEVKSAALPDGVLEASLTLLEGSPEACSFGFELVLPDWSEADFVLLPGAVYAGNRFRCRPVGYSPRYPEADARPDAATLTTDIPRLEIGPGKSRIQLLSGDLSAPMAGIWRPSTRTGCMLALRHPQVDGRDCLWEVEETEDRRTCAVRILAPGVRERRYSFRDGFIGFIESDDRGRVFRAGEQLTLRVRVQSFEARSVEALFARCFEWLQPEFGWDRARADSAELPISEGARLCAEKRARDDWRPSIGALATTDNPASPYQVQTGWCGGILAESALIARPEGWIVSRALDSLDTFLAKGQRETGFFFGKASRDGKWTEDFSADQIRTYTHRWTLTRRQADALWFLQAALSRIEARLAGDVPDAALAERMVAMRPRLEASICALAEALVGLWKHEGQLGHFIDTGARRVVVGGSASGALAPGAIAEASRRFDKPDWLAAAVEIGEFFYDRFTRLGYATGGPADAMQAPDSESTASLLESYTTLSEVTADSVWINRAMSAAHQLATWVMPYDYPYPPDSEFGRLGMPAAGSVFANAQNKHSAPGLCTHSGAGLLKLYRKTSDKRLLRLLADIARFLPWTVSRPDRPIRDPAGRALPAGWINERVNTSDWDHNIGGVFHGSTWSEVSLLLSAAELPGVYVDLDTGFCMPLDHIEARLEAGGMLVLRNPTRFEARVSWLAETGNDRRSRRFDAATALSLPHATLAPGEERKLAVRS